MFCDACGQNLREDQAFCDRCGKRVMSSVVALPVRGSRVRDRVRLLGILWVAYAGLNSIGAILINVANALYGRHLDMSPPMHALLSALCYALLGLSGLGIAAGVGLMKHEVWARTLALILAFVALFTNVPFGTALGVYTMWVLMSHESEQEYEIIAQARSAA